MHQSNVLDKLSLCPVRMGIGKSIRKANEMEKKVPERKVSLRDEDIFYVYDKRINKCIKEDCEGTVKYGLVLRVSMTGEETCNCFECNKCHMKYTPYPNYVRLTKTDMLTIYNKDEVDARDRKRAEDALKQAAREKKKQQGRKFAPRRDIEQGTEDRPYERKLYDRRPYEKKPYENKTYGSSYERKSYDGKLYERKTYEGKSYDRNSGERKSFHKKPYDKENYEKKPYERKPYEGKSYEKKSYTPRSYEDTSRGERTQGAKRKSNIIITTAGYKKPYRSDSNYQKNHH